GGVAIEATKTATLTVRNDSTMTAWLTGATFSNPTVGLQIGVETGPVSSGQTRTYTLSYRPSYVGPLETDVILHFTDGVSPSQNAQDIVVKLTALGAGVQAW